MKRLVPYLVFVLIAGGLVGFIYKDKIFPSPPGANPAAQQSANAGRRGGGQFRRGDQPIPVQTAKVKTEKFAVYLVNPGTVQAFNTATVRTQVSGRLIEVPYKEGDEVQVGDVVARIDPVLYQAAYDQAVAQKAKDEAILANARLDEARYTSLAKLNAASQQLADTAVWAVRQDEAQVKLDQAMIDNAKANLDFATIRASLAGRTGIRLVDTGNLVSSVDATGIVVITQVHPIAIIITVPQKTQNGEPIIPQILEAQDRGPVQLLAVVTPTMIEEGTVLVVDNQIDQTTGSFKIKGTFKNEKNRLWPGQFVNVKLLLRTIDNAITIPTAALQVGAKGEYVYLVTPEKTAKLSYVKVEQRDETTAVVSQGVSPGDLVVTSRFNDLQDGAKISVEAPQAETGASTETIPPGNPRQREAAAEQQETQGDPNPPPSAPQHKRGERGDRAAPSSAPGNPGRHKP